MTTLQFAVHATAQTREITHAGRQYLVAPVVALREGVLNGILVEAAEFAKYAASWAGRPVPLGHPQIDGQYISANSPDVWANDVPGHFWNVEADDQRLRGEIWIDLEKAERIGDRAMTVVQRLRANQPIEVSTGYFADTDQTPGVWKGIAYDGIARNIRPDHLAILADERGACSWVDGCGTPRVNEAAGKEESMNGEIEVQAEQERGLFERFLGWLGPRRAQEITSQENSVMAKCDLIAALTANQKCKFSKEKLETWEEGDLQALQESLAAHEEESAPPPPETPAQPESQQPPDKMAQFAQMVEGMDLDKLAAALNTITANADQERSQLVAGLMANERNPFDEAELTAMNITVLRKLSDSLQPRSYLGAAGGFSQPRGEQILAMPKVDWATGQIKEN